MELLKQIICKKGDENMDIKKVTELLKMLAALPFNEQEKVLAYAQGVSAVMVAKPQGGIT